MGRPAISTRWMIGSSVPRGRSTRARDTASFTSFSARSVSVSSRNEIVVFEIPSEIIEVMWWAPGTLETASSIVFVTCDSSSVDAAPNCVTVTEMRGTSTFGIRVTGSRPKLISPNATAAAASTIGGRGRLIENAEILSAMRHPLREPSLDHAGQITPLDCVRGFGRAQQPVLGRRQDSTCEHRDRSRPVRSLRMDPGRCCKAVVRGSDAQSKKTTG